MQGKSAARGADSVVGPIVEVGADGSQRQKDDWEGEKSEGKEGLSGRKLGRRLDG